MLVDNQKGTIDSMNYWLHLCVEEWILYYTLLLWKLIIPAFLSLIYQKHSSSLY